MKVLMIVNDTNFAWNLRREVLASFVEKGLQTCLLAKTLGFKTELETLGVKLIDLDIERRGTNPLSDLKLLNSYIRVLKKERPDIVFTNNIKPNVYAGLACQLLNIHYIANITGLGTAVEIPGKLQRLSIFLYRLGVRKADTLFFQNAENQVFFHQHRMIPKGTNEVLLPGSGVNLNAHPVLPWPDGPRRFAARPRAGQEPL